MKKYLKLYGTYAKLSLMSKLVYKANVIIGIVAFLFTEATSLFTLYILVSSVPSIDGYDIYQIGMLFGLTNMAVGIDHLLTDRLWTVAYWEVKTGKLDHMFLRPLPVLFQVIASEVQLEALGEIIVAIALILLCGINLNITVQRRFGPAGGKLGKSHRIREVWKFGSGAPVVCDGNRGTASIAGPHGVYNLRTAVIDNYRTTLQLRQNFPSDTEPRPVGGPPSGDSQRFDAQDH